ncbi:acyltransferase [Deinococcus sp. QL22]|uniref:acyltransferase family protein n=1 Tax=Deinococcus sp. QL22 TaxID=2939437 RepID=UPI002017B5BF|nr:acyltransferase [Deinococcus sp. QL22]UQN09686.1 acyltransferase [Deinococcus sp. QL22]
MTSAPTEHAGVKRGQPAPPDSPAPARLPQLSALTGVRFAAALVVVCLHSRKTLEGQIPDELMSFIRSGQVGVTFFFILSGFILTYTYATSEGKLNTPQRAFWLARLARIYPVYLLGLLLAAPYFLLPVLHRWPNATEWGAALLSPLLLQAWLPQTACIWNCPGWSLSVEAFFYALFPLALGFGVWRAGQGRGRQLGWTALLLWGLTLTPPLLYFLLSERPFPEESLVADTFYYNPLFRLPEFLLGMLLGARFLRGRRSSPRQAVWATVLGLAGTVLIMTFAHLFVPSFLRNTLIVPVLALLLWGLAHGGGWIARAFAWPPIVLLGEASYSLYILHIPVLQWLSSAWRRLLPGTPLDLSFFVVYLALLIPLSLLTYKLLERPAQQFLRRKWAKNGPRLNPS